MALTITFIEGWESGDWSAWDVYGAYDVAVQGSAPTGDYYGRTQTHEPKKLFTATDTKIFKTRIFYEGGGTGWIHWLYNGTVIGSVKMTSSTGKITVFVGATQVAESTHSININQWFDLEVFVKIADSGGRIVVRLNGVAAPEIDYTGDTKPDANTQIDGIQIGTWIDLDDFVLADGTESDIVGDLKVIGLPINGNGYLNEWTPSTGSSNYQCIDEVPYSDTDYVAVTANDKIDAYVMGNLPAGYGTPQAFQLQVRCKKDGTPTPQNIQLGLRESSTNHMSSNFAVESLYRSFVQIWTANISDLNNSEAVIQSKS